ncbi:MAG: PKD domain-containing protein [Bacteroidota bacterium]|nr:PKD domain-containing protein [Bacteroidota bacterium]
MKKLLLILMLGLISFSGINAQNNNALPDTADYPYWIEMMQDPEANYYETVKAFESYWEEREITKGSGWKPFKRWEYSMLFHIRPDGSRLPQDHDIKAYQEFKANNPPSRDFTGNWISLGPFDLPQGDRGYKGLGRLNALAFHPADADIIYVGAPQGGCWKTTDGGVTWESNTDDLPSLGVSSIIVDYNNPDNVYIGTGDRDAGDAAGVGVYKSDDAGETWFEHNNGMGNKIVGRLIQHPTDPQNMLAATSGGIYKTTDAGDNWVLKEGGNFKDIVFKPGNPNTVYAAKGGTFYKSSNNGESWNAVSNGLPGGYRGVIAVTPDNPNVVYFLITNSQDFKGLYRSSNSGSSFTEKSTTPNIMSWGCNGGSGGQAWYDLDIAADPNDEDIIYAGGVNCFKSSNGGVTWQINSHWWGDCNVPSVHADLHVLEWNPVDGRLYAGNDGGIYWTDNGGNNWIEITQGLAIGQVYKIGQSATVRDMCVNGYQDNGSSTYLGTHWQNVGGGDGMECAVDHEDATYSYYSLYYGSINRVYNNQSSTQVAGQGVNGITESGAWITPFCLLPANSEVMFAGYKNIWRCDDIKSYNVVWKKISDDLGGSNSQNLRVLESSPADENLLYAARYDNKMFRTENALDANPGWTDLTSLLPPGGTSPTDIEAHPTNPDVVYITYNSKVYKSEDKGSTWEDITENLPSTSLNTIEYYKNSPDGLYAGSNVGIYYRDNSMSEWVEFADGLPVASEITEVEIYYHPDSVENDVIRASTYGRGLWESEPYYYAPTADFYAGEDTIPVGCPLDYFDNSTGIPHYYQWTFEGASPETSTERNPQDIVYNDEGTFNVTLVISNPAGNDSITKEGFITVSATAVPNVNFTADATSICVGDTVHFTDETQNCPTGWLWEFDPEDVSFVNGTHANSQHPEVELTSAGSYTVTLTATNNAGNSSTTKTDYINSGGITIPFTEDFESGTLSANSWVVENDDFDKTWEIDSVMGTEPGNQGAWINFYNYYNLNARDRLISPSLDFSAYDHVGLTFKHAYAQRYSQKDSLIVLISDDCGMSWQRVWGMGPDGNGIFATSEPTTESFVPESSADWCGEGYGANCFEIDLSAWAGMNDIKIAFESYNQFGNNLYLDNIEISYTVGMNEGSLNAKNITIRPNPSKGLFTVGIPETKNDMHIEIFDARANSILKQKLNTTNGETEETFNLRRYPKGIYLVKIYNKDNSYIKKLVIE